MLLAAISLENVVLVVVAVSYLYSLGNVVYKALGYGKDRR